MASKMLRDVEIFEAVLLCALPVTQVKLRRKG
jgi:hypothetical protein